jgi:urease accessory protein
MSELASRLVALQQADSFFPGGAVAWSWGLETLLAEGRLGSPAEAGSRRGRGIRAGRSEVLAGFLEGQLRHRWGCFDRAFLLAAWRDAGDLPTLMLLDARIEALTLAAELRQGSRRLGLSMLGVHAGLGTPCASAYRAAVLNGQAAGHLPIVQGLVWRGLGMSTDDAQLAAAHSLCTGLVSAALRLGLVGHLEAQQTLTWLRPVVIDLLATAAPHPEQVHGFSPLAEIAVMRHETQNLRLFAN